MEGRDKKSKEKGGRVIMGEWKEENKSQRKKGGRVIMVKWKEEIKGQRKIEEG